MTQGKELFMTIKLKKSKIWSILWEVNMFNLMKMQDKCLGQILKDVFKRQRGLNR
jgi:hypothetical protein